MKPTQYAVSTVPLNHNYTIIQREQVGLVLTGAQVKLISAAKINARGSRVVFTADGQLNVVGLTIGSESLSVQALAHKSEIIAWKSQSDQQRLTWMVESIQLINGKFKANIALCKGKNKADKRAVDKTYTTDLQLAMIVKNNNK